MTDHLSGEANRRRLCVALLPKDDAKNGSGGSQHCGAPIAGPASGGKTVTELRFDNVWDAIEDTKAEAENMRLRSSLMSALTDHITERKLNQAEAAKLFGVTQPRISDLMRGKIDLFGLDTLVNMLGVAGLRVELQVAKAA
jgi:predicted XRE-type DNA-binding protein